MQKSKKKFANKKQQPMGQSKSTTTSTTIDNNNHTNSNRNSSSSNSGSSTTKKTTYSPPVPPSAMQMKCTNLEKLFNELQLCNENKISKLDYFTKLNDLLHTISNTIFIRDNKNDFFLNNGLNILCKLFNQLSTINLNNNLEEINKLFEEIFSDISFILYKMSEHTKARNQMLLNGILFSLWHITQYYIQTNLKQQEKIKEEKLKELQKLQKKQQKNNNKQKNDKNTINRISSGFYQLRTDYNKNVESLIYHMNEVMELLGGELSLGFEFGNLLMTANREYYFIDKQQLDNDNDYNNLAGTSREVSDSNELVFGCNTVDCYFAFIGKNEILQKLQNSLQKECSKQYYNFIKLLGKAKEFNLNFIKDDFDIKVHSVMIRKRAPKLLNYFLQWIPETDELKLLMNQPCQPNGYYFYLEQQQDEEEEEQVKGEDNKEEQVKEDNEEIKKDKKRKTKNIQKITKFAFLKFLQIVYTDQLSMTEKDITFLKKENNNKEGSISIENVLKKNGLITLLNTLQNEMSIKNILYNLQEDKSLNYQILQMKTNSLFDEFDEELIQDEYRYFFGTTKQQQERHKEIEKQRNSNNSNNKNNGYGYHYGFYSYYYAEDISKNYEVDRSTSYWNKKEKIKKNALKSSALENDFFYLFKELIGCKEEDEEDVEYNNELKEISYCDVKLCTENGELGEMDYLVLKDKELGYYLNNIQQQKGIYVHCCVLSARSDYLRKVFQYEIKRNNDNNNQNESTKEEEEVPTISVPNISYCTLLVIIQYIYCGLSSFEVFSLIKPELLIECFIASDLFLLFGLKKFLEQQICIQLGKQYDYLSSNNISDNKNDIEKEEIDYVNQIYELALLYNSESLKVKCQDILKSLGAKEE